MAIKVLCIGDVVGSPGRRVLTEGLGRVVKEHDVDCVVVNAENAANGSGLTPDIHAKIVRAGAHLLTMGDHVYRRREIFPILETNEFIVRPANLPHGAPGREFAIYVPASGQRVAVFCLLGRMFMNVLAECPYRAADRVLKAIPDDVKMIIVDMHAEATSEKIALGWHLDGRVSIVFGTHTHIPTADECVLPGGTAYITDVGMTGPYDSVIGNDKTAVIERFRTQRPVRFSPAEGDVRLCAVLIDADPETGRANSIERPSLVFSETFNSPSITTQSESPAAPARKTVVPAGYLTTLVMRAVMRAWAFESPAKIGIDSWGFSPRS